MAVVQWCIRFHVNKSVITTADRQASVENPDGIYCGSKE